MVLEEALCQQNVPAAMSNVMAKRLGSAVHHLKCLLITNLGVLYLCTDAMIRA